MRLFGVELPGPYARHQGLLDALHAWRLDEGDTLSRSRHALADLGYVGEADQLTVPRQDAQGRHLGPDQKCYSLLQAALHAVAERSNAPTTRYWKSLSPCLDSR